MARALGAAKNLVLFIDQGANSVLSAVSISQAKCLCGPLASVLPKKGKGLNYLGIQLMGNPASRGQQRDKPFRDALRMEAALAEQGDDTPARKGSLRWIARNLLERAGEETAAVKEIADRLDGKPAQAIVGGDESDPALRVLQEIRHTIVDPKHTEHTDG